MRIMDGDISGDALFNITSLSTVLSNCLLPRTLEDFIFTALKRTLIFPLCRNWDIFIKVLEDLSILLKKGRVPITKCLLRLVKLFRNHEDAWRISKIWLEDYAVWAQSEDSAFDTELSKLADYLDNVRLGMLNDIDGGREVAYRIPRKNDFEIAGWNISALESLVEDDQGSETDSSTSKSSYSNDTSDDYDEEVEKVETEITLSGSNNNITSSSKPKKKPLIPSGTQTIL